MKIAKLEAQYAKFPEIHRDEVKKFVQWIHAQPHMPNLSEEEALHFFHACKYSMEISKQVLDINLTCRTHVKEFFGNLDIESNELKKAMKIVTAFPLPKATTEGYRIFVARLEDLSLTNFHLPDILKLYCMVMDYWLMEEGIQNGLIIVMDVKNLSMGHLTRIGIMVLKKFFYYLQEAIALRLISFHFINTNSVMDRLMSMVRPLLKKELSETLHLHSCLDDFHKFVPQNILPPEYGGSEIEGIKLRDIYYNKLRENRLEMMEFGKRHQINENLRPGKPKNASDLFGIEGNFKKFDFD